MVKNRAVGTLSLTLLTSCATNVPTTYPIFEWKDATPAVAVVDVSPGAYLPEMDECKRPDVWCLHSPFWFNARVKQVVYGDVRSNQLKVATLSHYGMDSYKRPKEPWLVALAFHQNNVVMPLYSADSLARSGKGDLFILVRYPHQPAWLPCSVAELRQPVKKSDFPNAEFVPADDYSVQTNPELYVLSRKGAFPRYGIGISAIREHLALIKPSAADMDCDVEAAESQ